MLLSNHRQAESGTAGRIWERADNIGLVFMRKTAKRRLCKVGASKRESLSLEVHCALGRMHTESFNKSLAFLVGSPFQGQVGLPSQSNSVFADQFLSF